MRIEFLTWFFSITTLIILFSTTIPVHSQCLEDQKSLLLQLKNSLQFDPDSSVKLVDWTESNDCCQWNGVTCDRFGRVTGLDLNTESVSGGLNDSSSLFELKFLQKLNLAYNSFNSTRIPSRFGILTSLAYLNISNTDFVGQIPMELSRLTRLVKLDLSKDYSGFSIRPPGIQIENPNLFTLFRNLSGLTELYLDGVNISANGYEWGQAISSSLPNLRVLSLSDCLLSGPIDSSLQNLQYLSEINLAANNLSSPVPVFFANFPNLTVLILRETNMYGTFPDIIFQQVQTLEKLDLSHTKLLNGSLPDFPQHGSLQNLELGDTSFSGNLPESIGNLRELRRIEINGCYFNGPIPSSLANLSQLDYLDFSANNFSGSIPSFRGSESLTSIDLSQNALTGPVPSIYFEGLSNLLNIKLAYNSFHGSVPSSLFSLPSMQVIDLSYNQFDEVPGFLPNGSLSPLVVLDLSTNKIQGSFPSYNMLSGPIPPSICNCSDLEILNLSNNRFSGTIPQCLIDKGVANLRILNLQNNNLTGNIMGTFPEGCTLRTLELNGNHLEGEVPKSLANCASVEVLNLGTNNINGYFPCFLVNLSELHVLVLRSNKFHGNIGCQGIHNYIWPKLQIIDLALNNFNGILPPKFFSQRQATMDGGNAQPSNHLRFVTSGNIYQDSVTIVIKGAERKLVKILTIYTTIDFSNNMFEGEIPDTVGDLKALYVLNLSHNALTGSIPSSLGNLSTLGSLDLSRNKLGGRIPEKLASLTFLSFLNLSYNQLVGMIPIGTQLQSFPAASYEGNKGLWGAPLTACCKKAEPAPPPLDGTQSYTDEDEINWVYIVATLGYTVGFGVVVVPLLYSQRWRQCYYKPLDRVIVRILHHREQQSRNQRRRNNINQLRSRQHH